MNFRNETELQRSIQAFLTDLGWWTYKFKGTSYSPGIPDLIAVKKGETVWIEAKMPGEWLRPTQRAVIWSMARSGSRILIVSSVEEVACLLT